MIDDLFVRISRLPENDRHRHNKEDGKVVILAGKTLTIAPGEKITFETDMRIRRSDFRIIVDVRCVIRDIFFDLRNIRPTAAFNLENKSNKLISIVEGTPVLEIEFFIHCTCGCESVVRALPL